MAYSYDGSLRFRTEVDQTGFTQGIASMKSAAVLGAQAIAAGITVAAGAVTALSAYAVKVGADFEAGMSRVSAISGATEQDLAALTEKAKEMGATTKFSATESAEALQYMAMAGWKTEAMLDGLPGIMNLAAASGEELGTVADIVTDAMTAFGLGAEESGHFADVLAAASSNANTNVGLMGATFKYVAPVAGALGYSVEDMAVAIGLMANAGIKGEMAGTQLRSVITRMANPTKSSAAAMEALGMSMKNADGTMKDFNGIIQELRQGMSGLTEEEKASYAAMLGGQEAMSGLLAIASASEEDFAKLTSAIETADGAAAEMAQTMNDNLQGDMTVLGSTAEGVGIKLYEKFETPLRRAAQAATESLGDVLQSLNSGQLDKGVDKIADSAGKLLAKAAALAAEGIPKLINGFGLLVDHGDTAKKTMLAAGAAFAVFRTTVVLTPIIKAWQVATAAVVAHQQAQQLMLVTSNGGLTVMQTAVALLTGKIHLQTAATGLAARAQLALNASMAANPALWVAGGLAVLTGALVLLGKQESETKKRTKELNEALAEQRQARAEAEEAREETINQSVAEIDHAATLIEKYVGITDANGKIKEGYEGRARALEEQINSLIPGAITLTEKEGEMYLQVADNLDVLIAKKKISALLDANQEEYTAAIKNRNTYVDELREAQEGLAAAEEDLMRIEAAYADAAKNGGVGIQYEKRKREAEEQVAAERARLEESKAIYAQSVQDIEDYHALMYAENSANLEEINAVLDAQLNATAEYTNKSKEEMDRQLSDRVGNYAILLKLAQESGYKLTETAVQNVIAARQALQKETDAYLATGEEIPAALAEGIKRAEGAFQTAVSQMVANGSISQEQADAFKKDFIGVGGTATEGLEQGTADPQKLSGLAKASEQLTSIMINAVKAGLDAHSPSRVAIKLGQYFTEGIALGIIAGQVLQKVRQNAAMLAQSADKAVRVALKINSPSGVAMETAGFYGEGFALGIADSKDKILQAVTALSDDAIFAAKRQATSYKDLGTRYIEAMKAGISGQTETVIAQVEKLVDAQVEAFSAENKEAQADYKKAARELMGTYRDVLKAGAEEANALVSEKIKGITEAAQKQYDEIVKQRDRLQQKLSGFGDLFYTDEDGEMKLENIDKQIDAIQRYEAALQKLKEKGIAEGLLNEIVDMGVENGTDFAEELLSKSNAAFERYNLAWTEKQELAKTVAEKFYADELETLNASFTEELDVALASIPEECTNVGIDAMQGVINGMESRRSDAVATARSIADAIIRELKRATETASPSKRAAREVGAPLTQGIIKGMQEAYDPLEMERYADRMLADVSHAQSRAAQSVSYLSTSHVLNSSSTYNGGDLVLKIEKMVNDGKGSVSSLLQEAELYRRQRASATGGI